MKKEPKSEQEQLEERIEKLKAERRKTTNRANWHSLNERIRKLRGKVRAILGVSQPLATS